MSSPPSTQEIVAAMARAVAHRRAIYETDLAYAGHSNLMERISGVTGQARQGDDDWWQIGSVVDTITGEEFAVWYRPRRLRLRPRYPQRESPPPRFSRYYQRGDNLQWMDRETDQPVRRPDGSIYGGKERPDWVDEDA